MSDTGKKPWLKKYPAGARPNIEYPEMSMPQLLDKAARDFPDRKAIIFEGVGITYRWR